MQHTSRSRSLDARALQTGMNRALAFLFVLFLGFATDRTSPLYASESGPPEGSKKLYLADFGNDRIWIMNLDTREVLTSYPAPTREFGQDAMPIGSAWFRGRLYVNNQNSTILCSDDNLFALDPQSGVVLGQARTPGCNPIDGMAAIPEAGLLAGIETQETQDIERLHLFRPVFQGTQLSLTSVAVIDIDVPDIVVRGLAYLNGKVYVSEESTGSIYIYRLDLSTMTVVAEGSISIGTAAPGLATLDEGHLIAYDIFNHRLLIVEARPNGQITDTIPLESTGIGVVAALETERRPPVSNVNDLVTFEPDPSTFSFTPDTTGCPGGFAGKFNFDATLVNVSNQALATLEILVAELTKGNLLLTENGPMGEGGIFGVPQSDGFTDGRLSQGEFVDVPFAVCLQERRPFRLFVDVLGKVLTPVPMPAS